MTKPSSETLTTALTIAGKIIGVLITALAIIVWTRVSATQEAVQELTIQQAKMIYKDSIINERQVLADSLMIRTMQELKNVVNEHVNDGDIHVTK